VSNISDAVLLESSKKQHAWQQEMNKYSKQVAAASTNHAKFIGGEPCRCLLYKLFNVIQHEDTAVVRIVLLRNLAVVETHVIYIDLRVNCSNLVIAINFSRYLRQTSSGKFTYIPRGT
jgi:hypothetical protein